MLFANIAALVAKGVTVQFTINAASEGKLEVSLIPTAAEGTTLNLVPKSFVGTPAELDAEFGDVIAGYAAVKRQLVGNEKPKRATLKDARAFIDGKYPKDLQAVVADALALLAAVKKRASALKGSPFRPRAGDFGQTYMDDDDPLMSIGATCFVVWDDADFSWEAATCW